MFFCNVRACVNVQRNGAQREVLPIVDILALHPVVVVVVVPRMVVHVVVSVVAVILLRLRWGAAAGC